MSLRLRHRGPDGHGQQEASFVAVAATRLAMVDAPGGGQPMRSPDGRYLLVYNGELYNHDALRARLPGPWRSRCDTETVLAAWTQWGEEAIDQFDGMFAFFVWDEQLKRGTAVRDRLGVKPLAYQMRDGVFAFASEAAAVLAANDEPPRANLDAIIEVMVAPAFSGVSRSPFSQIEYLRPGHVARVDRSGLQVRRYWRWSFAPAGEDEADAPTLSQDLRRTLRQAVDSCLHADVPLGLFLSGGLDSTAIAAFARREQGSLPAWTVTFDGEAEWDLRRSALVVSRDTPFARDVARELDMDLHEVRLERTTLAQQLRHVAAANDALPAWEQELAQHALARAASRSVKGVLVGDAADETHFGYHFLLDDIATSGPRAIMARLGSVPVRREVDPCPAERLDTEYRTLVETSGVSYSDPKARVQATSQLVIERWLPRLLHNGDIHTMRFGLEARVPFASNPLLAVAARVPPAMGLYDGVEKWALRNALRNVVPETIRTRRKSALPKDQGADLLYQTEASVIFRDPHPVVRQVVDLDAMMPMLASHSLTESERAQLFRVICLHHWAVAHRVREAT